MTSAGHPAPILYSAKNNRITELKTINTENQFGVIGFKDFDVSFVDDILIYFYNKLLSKIRIYVYKIMRQGKGVSKPSEAIASFHEMKFAVVARLFEGQSPEFRSHRRMSPWNSNR